MLTSFRRFALASILVAASAVAMVVPAQALTKINAGTVANFEGLLPLWAAEDLGYLKAADIEINMLDFVGGAPAVQAFIGGSIDICFCAGDHVVRMRSRHFPAVFLYGFDNRHDYTLIGKKGLPTNIADLKGKSLGITSPGSMTDNTLRWEIDALKLDPETDYQLVAAGVGASMIAAIDSGKVDAGMVVLMDRVHLLNEPGGKFEILKDYTSLPYASFSALTTETWIKANPGVAHALFEAFDKACADLKRDPEIAKRIIAKRIPTYTPELVDISAKNILSRIPDKGHYTDEEIKNLNDIMIAADPSLKPIDPIVTQPKL